MLKYCNGVYKIKTNMALQKNVTLNNTFNKV